MVGRAASDSIEVVNVLGTTGASTTVHLYRGIGEGCSARITINGEACTVSTAKLIAQAILGLTNSTALGIVCRGGSIMCPPRPC